MNDTKHTPGPWEIQGPKIQEDFGDQTYWAISTSKPEIKSGTYKMPGFYYPHSVQTTEESEANAKLISAAPELLENLTRIIDRIEENGMQANFPSAYERAQAAIKKATK